MRKFFIFYIAVLMIGICNAQECNPPVNLSIGSNTHSAVTLNWELPSSGRTRSAGRMELFNQADLVTHPMAGAGGADVSALYGGQTMTEQRADQGDGFVVADDFLLRENAHISEMEFYAYQPGSATTSEISGVYVRIYDRQPSHPEARIVWGDDETNVLSSVVWSHIYRTSGANLAATDRPVMKITAALNTELEAGNYWIAVSFSDDEGNAVYATPRADLNQARTGNALAYNPGQDRWESWLIGGSQEQMGLPFLIRGFNVDDNIAGFKIYRDQILLNDELVGRYTYTDMTVNPGATYCYYVQAVYVDDCISPLSGNVCTQTPEDPCVIAALPYQEPFDTYRTGQGTYPGCWTKYSTNASEPYITNAVAVSSPGSLLLPGSEDQYSMAVAPLFTEPVNQLQVEFNFRKAAATASVDVGIVSDLSDPANSFTLVRNVTTASQGVWEKLTVDFGLYPVTGDPAHIAFRSKDGSLYLDDIFVNFIPTCSHVSSLISQNPTSGSIEIAWTPGGEEPEWSIEYKPVDEEGWMQIDGLAEPKYVINDLEPGKTYSYQVRVKAVCTPWDESSWVEEIFNFTLPCGALTDLPYQDDFESYQAAGKAAAGELPACWNAYTTNTLPNYKYAPHIVAERNSINSGSQSMFMTSYGVDNRSTLILPEFEESLNSLYLKFWAKASNSSVAFSLGYVTDNSNDNTFTALTAISTASTGKEFEIFLDQFTIPQGAFLAFQCGGLSGSYEVYIDDIYVNKIPSCRVPKDLMLVDAGFDTAHITWTSDGTETKWMIGYKADHEDNWSTEEIDQNPTAILRGLEPGTDYEVRVKALCSPDDESEWNTISIFTTCKITTLPYTENFESYAASTQEIKCWELPSLALFAANGDPSSPKYLMFGSMDGNTLVKVVMQALDEAFDITTLSLTLKANKGSGETVTMVVGVLDDQDNMIPVETIAPVEKNTWEQFVVSFAAYQGTGRYIYFQSSMIYIDDIVLDVATDCPATTGIAVSDIDENNATVSWNSKSGQSYDLQYRMDGESDWMVIEDTVSPAYLTSLEANSRYEVRIVTHCESQAEPLISSIINFNTSCGNITVLPYETTFDRDAAGENTRPYCWSIYGSGADVYVGNTVYYSSPASLVFNPSNTDGIMAALPALDGSILVSSLRLSFMMRTGTTTDSLYIGFVNAPGAHHSFEFFRAVSPAETEKWTEMIVDLSGVSPNGRHIAFRVGNRLNSSVYVDNIYLEMIPSCERPDSVTVRDITSGGAMVSWSADDNSHHWVLSYRAAGEETWITVDELTTPTYLFTDLESNVTYEVKVMKYCDPYDFSRWSNTVAFRTYCPQISELPFTETFLYGSARVLPDCWIKNTTPYSRADVYVTNTSSPNTLDFTTPQNTYAAAIIPQFTVPVNQLYATFKMYVSSIGPKIKVGVMSDPYDMSTFELIEVITPSRRMVWDEHTVYFSNYAGTGRFIVLLSDAVDQSATNYFYLDDLTIDLLPDCMFPFDIRITDRRANKVTVDWAGSEEADRWEIICAPVGEDLENATPQAFYGKPLILEGLEPATTYNFRLRTYCTTDEESFYSPVQQFTTRCDAIEIPYHENFDTYGTGTDVFIDCWTAYSSQSSYPSISFTHFSYPGALYFTTAAGAYKMAVTPEIDADLNTLQVRFMMKAASTENNVIIGAVRDPDSVSSFEPIQTVNARTTAWNEFLVPLTGYNGNAKYLAFRVEGTTSRTILIDNLVIEELSSCTNPVGLYVADQTDTSAVLHWTDDFSASGWQVIYGLKGFEPDSEESITVDVNSLYINGLTSGTSYDFYVKKSCDENIYSEWSLPYNFNTLCNPVHLPYTENFDSYGTGAGTYPICWYKYNSSPNATNPYITTEAYAGEGALNMMSSMDQYILAVAPPVHEDYNMDDIYVEVMVRKSFTVSSKLDVGYMTDPARPETFVNVKTVSPDLLSAWQSLSVSFRGENVQGRYVAFRSENGNSANNISIDEVMIDLLADCEAPADPVVSAITGSSALVTWNTEGNDWILAYKETSATDWTTVNHIEQNRYEITSLSPNTGYEVRLRANCITGEEVWSGTATFTTTCGIAMAPFHEDFEGAEFAPDCWSMYEGDVSGIFSGTSGLTPTVSGWERSEDGHGLHGAHAVLNLSGNGEHYWLSTPVIDIEPLTTPVLYFRLALTGHGTGNGITGNADDKFMVLIATQDGQTWLEANTVVWANDGTGDYYFSQIGPVGYLVTVPLAQYSGEKIRIAFYGESTAGDRSVDLHLDRVDIVEEQRCAAPVITSVTPSEEEPAFSRLIVWDAVPIATGWVLEYRNDRGEDNWHEITCTSDCAQNSYLLTGLDGYTEYEIRVRVHCGLEYSDWSPVYTFSIIGLDEYDLSGAISVFPNPAQNQVRFRISDPELRLKQISLFDIYGKQIRTIPTSDLNHGIDIQELSSGIYFIRFETGKGMVTKKFIKE